MVNSAEIQKWKEQWRQNRDRGSLSKLYNQVISLDDGPRDYDEILELLGEPTHNQLRDNMSEYSSSEGGTIILLHWTKTKPRKRNVYGAFRLILSGLDGTRTRDLLRDRQAF